MNVTLVGKLPCQGKKRYKLTPSWNATNEMSNPAQQNSQKTLQHYITCATVQLKGVNEPLWRMQNQVYLDIKKVWEYESKSKTCLEMEINVNMKELENCR